MILQGKVQSPGWTDEVKFVGVVRCVSEPDIMPGAVNVGALLDVWPIMGGNVGI